MAGGLRLLSVEVTSKGFSFAVLEGPEHLIDWGGRETPGADLVVFLGRLGRVIDRYRPDLIVLEEPAGSRKGARVRERLVWAEQYSSDREIRCRALARTALAQYTGAEADASRQTPLAKDAIAAAVARQFPELARSLPRPRRPWQSEARAMAVFIAVARGCVAFSLLSP